MNGAAMRKFRSSLVSSNRIKTQGISQIEVKTDNISKISGKTVGQTTPSEFITSSLAYSKSPVNTVDPGMTRIQYDDSCNGAVSPFSSPAHIKDGYLLTPTTFMPNAMDIEDIKRRRNWSTKKEEIPKAYTGRVKFNYENIFIEPLKETCTTIQVETDPAIKITISNIANKQKISQNSQVIFNVQASNPIRSISFLIDDEVVNTYQYYGKETTTA